MNIERLEQVAKVLESGNLPGERQFDMGHWDCGTACCIGGLTELLFDLGSVTEVAPALGINSWQAGLLFNPDGRASWCRNPELGAQAIRNLIADPKGDPWRHVNGTSSDV